jgi:3-methyladenine DNA glycosylase Mpg
MSDKIRRLGRSFYEQSTLKVARELLGKYIVRIADSKKLTGKIVERSYIGPKDKASHAYGGKVTPATGRISGGGQSISIGLRDVLAIKYYTGQAGKPNVS